MKSIWTWHYVYFEDEAPRIGAGWRPVLAKTGYKWVQLRPPGTERGTKIKREIWDKLRKSDHYENKIAQERDSPGLTNAKVPLSCEY